MLLSRAGVGDPRVVIVPSDRDGDFPRPGEVLTTRDLAYRADRLAAFVKTASDPQHEALRRRCTETLRWISAVRKAHPQVIRFRILQERGRLVAEPLDTLWQRRPNQTVSADLCVIGGELEAVITATAAADRGLKVVLLYAGPLGGIVADSGANLRYFDGYHFVPRPPEQRRVFRDAFGMPRGSHVSLPANIEGRLLRYLSRHYEKTIERVKTTSYDSLYVQRTGNKLVRVVTPEGVAVTARTFVDMDPEARVTEKAGIPMDAHVPDLASGIVFTVQNLVYTDRDALRRTIRLPIEEVCAAAGVPLETLDTTPELEKPVRRFRKRFRQDFLRLYDEYGVGWTSLAEGFHLYMQLVALRDRSPALRWLNARRVTSGFNVAFRRQSAVFNGISYHLGPNVLQHSHDILTEPRWRAFREVERPALVRYLSAILDNEHITVHFPRQFYVRRASAYFRTRKPYTAADFQQPVKGQYWMAYPNDLRDARERDARDRALLRRIKRDGSLLRWTCRPSASLTEVENLYSLNKSAMPPEYFGCLRILQNLATTGVALAEELGRKAQGAAGATTATHGSRNTRSASARTSSGDTASSRSLSSPSASQRPSSSSASAKPRARSAAR